MPKVVSADLNETDLCLPFSHAMGESSERAVSRSQLQHGTDFFHKHILKKSIRRSPTSPVFHSAFEHLLHERILTQLRSIFAPANGAA
jgi:hypothetical protein